MQRKNRNRSSVSAMPPPRDYSMIAPKTTMEKLSLRTALAYTREDFFSYFGTYPDTATDEWSSYVEQYDAIQHEFTLLWQSVNHRKPIPILFGFVGWTGGITNWPRIKRTEEILYTYAKPNRAPLVTLAERQRAAERLSKPAQSKDTSIAAKSGSATISEHPLPQPPSKQNPDQPTPLPSKIDWLLSANPKDGRSKPPNLYNESEMISLDKALSHSRMAFNHYIGRLPHPTNRTACYAAQYHQMYVEFQDAWKKQRTPESVPPKLFCLPGWEGGITDWKAPVEDQEYMKPFLFSLKRWPRENRSTL